VPEHLASVSRPLAMAADGTDQIMQIREPIKAAQIIRTVTHTVSDMR